MNEMNRLISSRNAVFGVAALTLLVVAPADAGWLGRGIGVAGAGHALHKITQDNTSILDKVLDAVIDGDRDSLEKGWQEIKKTPGKLIKHAFPILDAPAALANQVKSAKEKVVRFVGGVNEKVTDARAALVISKDNASEARVLSGRLPTPSADVGFLSPRAESASAKPATTAGATKSAWAAESASAKPAAAAGATKSAWAAESASAKPAAAAGTAKSAWAAESASAKAAADAIKSSWAAEQAQYDSWAEWALSAHLHRPHCYGVVDVDNLPADCFGAPTPSTFGAKPSSDSRSNYQAALADALGEESGSADDSDYIATLNALEEAERQRIAAEEAERQRIAAAEEAERRRIAVAEEAERRRIAAAEEADEERRLVEEYREYQARESARRRETINNIMQGIIGAAQSYNDAVIQSYGGGASTRARDGDARAWSFADCYPAYRC